MCAIKQKKLSYLVVCIFFLCFPLFASQDRPVYYALHVPVGSVSDDFPGMAHLVEHLKFKNRGEHSYKTLDNVPGIQLNAFTTYFRTWYVFKATVQEAEVILETMASVLEPITVSDQEVEFEKNIVTQEYLQRFKSHPDADYHTDFESRFYKNTALATGVIGSLESINTITRHDIEHWNDQYYPDAQAIVMIVGPLESSQVQLKAKSIFPSDTVSKVFVNTSKATFPISFIGNADNTPVIPVLDQPVAPEQPFELQYISNHQSYTSIRLQKIYLADDHWRDQLPARDLLTSIIWSYLTEGLHEKIAEKNRLVRGWDLKIDWPIHGYWEVKFSANLESGVSAPMIKQTLGAYFQNLVETGISEKSFQRVKKRMIRKFHSRWDDLHQASRDYLINLAYYGKSYADQWGKRLSNLTRDQVNDFLKTFSRPPVREGILIIQPVEEK